MTKTRFVVLATPRSGSTVFRLWLNSHRLIRCHDEVLLKRLDALDSIHHYVKENKLDELPGNSYDRDSLGYPDDDFSDRLLRDFLDDLHNNRDRCGPWDTPGNMQDFHPITGFDEELAVGMKLMYYALDNRFLSYWITSGSVRIIHLVRENILKQFLSYTVAQKRKLWFSDKHHEPVKVPLDPLMVRGFIERMETMHAGIQRQFPDNPYMNVSYEAFCNEPQALIPGICDFLDVPVSELSMPTLKKLNPVELSGAVENYNELVATLRGSRFEKYLD